MGHHKRWRDLTAAQRTAIGTAASAQILLAGAAWWDLAHRPAIELRGPKWLWAIAIAVNFVGPVLYFARGRATTTGQSA
jgi:hypothetical protein